MIFGSADARGVFGLIGHGRAAWFATLALEQLAHRGGRDCGMVVGQGTFLRAHRGQGDVAQVFGGHELQMLSGKLALAQVGTASRDGLMSEQPGPYLARSRDGQLAASLVGGLTNGRVLREELFQSGAVLTGDTDTEVVLQRIAMSSQQTFISRVLQAIAGLEGAWALVLVTPGRLVASRDPRGIRPLWLGKIDGALACCTEVGPITAIGGEVLREVRPGEVLVLDRAGASSVTPFLKDRPAPCAAEWLSLSRADAQQGRSEAWPVRVALGRALAKEQPCPQGQVVVPLPQAQALAEGYAEVAGLPCSPALEYARPRGAQPLPLPELDELQEARQRFRVVPAVVRDKVVVLVSSVLLRGRTLRDAVRVLGAAGAREVHVRIGAPWIRNGCLYGVDMPRQSELAAVEREAPGELRPWLGADTLACLSPSALRETLKPLVGPGLCDGCATGEFPVRPPRDESQDQLLLFE